MSSPLEKPWSLAELVRFEGPLSGVIPIAVCRRLIELQGGSDEGEIVVAGELSTRAVEATPGEPAFVGTASTFVRLTCERCLKKFDFALEASFAVVFIAAIGERQDGPDFDFWELGCGTVRPADVVEEYLVLALPLAVKHADDECAATAAESPIAETDGRPTQSPFAGLRAELDKQRHSD